MNESLIELGAGVAILELGFWVLLFYIMYRHNRREENVQ